MELTHTKVHRTRRVHDPVGATIKAMQHLSHVTLVMTETFITFETKSTLVQLAPP